MPLDWIAETDDRFDFPNATDAPRHTVYVKGDGPPILILQELPGIGIETFDLADRLIAEGFKVYLPHLFGALGETISNPLKFARRLWCIRHEFQVFRTGRQSEIASWMRALCAEIQSRENGAQLGVIGMCLTGSFVIPLMAEDAVKGAVASQPALPMVFRKNRLHMSQTEVENACAAMTTKGPALAMRFKSDRISTSAHIQALKSAFGDHLEVAELDNPAGVTGSAHSLLTLDFSDEAWDRTSRYFKSRFGLEKP